MKILKSLDLNRLKTLQENFKIQIFKLMVKNLQEKLHQGYLDNQRVQKCKKCSKTFYKKF